MNIISNWFFKISHTWVTILGLTVFILFTIFILPAQSHNAEARSGNDQSPDTSFLYNKEDLYQMAELYAQPGRDAYIRARYQFDIIWPIVYTFFLMTSISWLGLRGLSPESHYKVLNLIPLLGLTFDFLENLSASLVMLRYPSLTPGLDFLVPVFTFFKWIFLGISFVILITLLVLFLKRVLTKS